MLLLLFLFLLVLFLTHCSPDIAIPWSAWPTCAGQDPRRPGRPGCWSCCSCCSLFFLFSYESCLCSHCFKVHRGESGLPTCAGQDPRRPGRPYQSSGCCFLIHVPLLRTHLLFWSARPTTHPTGVLLCRGVDGCGPPGGPCSCISQIHLTLCSTRQLAITTYDKLFGPSLRDGTLTPLVHLLRWANSLLGLRPWTPLCRPSRPPYYPKSLEPNWW